MALWTNVDGGAGNKPKYLTDAEKTATSAISVAEAELAANKAKGVAHAGWVKYSTYTDAQGATRHKSEVLVAMSSIYGDQPADSTTIGINPVITIVTQPEPASVTAPAPASFTVAATVNNNRSLSYRWEVSTDSGSTWDPISGATGATLTIADTTGLDLNQYRVVVMSTDAADVTSDEVLLEVA